MPQGERTEYDDHRAGPGVPPDLPPLGRRTMRLGARGDRVHTLQRRLKEFGYDPGPQDGIYGLLTYAAVRELQRHLGHIADGVADGRLLDALSDSRLVHMQEPLVVAEPHASIRSSAAVRMLARYGPRWHGVAGAGEFVDGAGAAKVLGSRPASMEGWHVVHTRGTGGPGHYDPELLQRLLHRSSGRDSLIREALHLFGPDGGATGVNGVARRPEKVYVDLGTIGWGDGGAVLKLLRRIRRDVVRRGAQLVVSLPLTIGDGASHLFKAVDVGSLADVAHTVVLVPPVFIEGKSSRKGRISTPPRPPSPGEISVAVRDVVAEVPSWRCLLLLSLASLAFEGGGKASDGFRPPTLLAHRQALALAYSHRTRPRWDQHVGRPVFYGGGEPSGSVVWLENRESIRAKLSIVHRRRLGGVYLFAVGMEDPRMWTLFPRRGHVSPPGAI